MKITKQFIVTTLLVLGTFITSIYGQRKIPPKPKLQTAVYDEANMLAPYTKQLDQKLIRYADTTSTQIVVATINSLQGENIGLYAAEWAHEWGIGQEKEDNGVFILVAKNDRKIFIATGYGVEEKLTDATTKTIIDEIITPEFKKGNYYLGLDNGTTAIFQVLDGTFKGSRKKPKAPIGQFILVFIIFIIIVAAFRKSNHGQGGKGNRGNRSGSGSLLDIIILSNMGRGGYSGGSFGGGSSGGFGGGFGGGGFGGGGAGGSW